MSSKHLQGEALKNQDIPIWRHQIFLGPVGKSDEPMSPEDRFHLTLNFADSLRQRLSGKAGPNAMPVGFALSGPAAIGVLGGHHHQLWKGFDVIVAHAQVEQVLGLYERELTDRNDPYRDLRLAFLKNARYLRLDPTTFQARADKFKPQPANAIQQVERGYRVAMHAAIKAATVSRVRLVRGGGEYSLTVPLLGPDASLVAGLAQYGRAVLYAAHVAASLAAPQPMSAEQRAQGEQFLLRYLERAQVERMRLEESAPLAIALRGKPAVEAYHPLGDRIFQDSDAAAVIDAALDPRPEFVAAIAGNRNVATIVDQLLVPLTSKTTAQIRETIKMINRKLQYGQVSAATKPAPPAKNPDRPHHSR